MTRTRDGGLVPLTPLGALAATTPGLSSVSRPETASTPAFRLRYVRTGPRTDTPVVVIPGGPGLASVLPYRGLRRTAARGGLDVLMVEHRGVGLSRADQKGRPLPASALWITEVLDDLAAVLDHEGVDAAHIVGSSYGSYLASSFGARHPERVRSIVLDSALQSAHDLDVERAAIRARFWDADDSIARAMHRLVGRGDDQRLLLDVARAAFELGGAALLTPLLERRIRTHWDPVWQALELYATRDGSLARIPGIYEFDLVGTIGFRELGYGGAGDGLPLDPARTYAPIAHRFPAFAREPYDLVNEARRFTWPLVLVSGDRDLRTPPEIARRAADAAQDATIVPIQNGHSALDTHPIALLNVMRQVVRGHHHDLSRTVDTLNALPKRGVSARFPDLLQAGVTIERALTLTR